MKSHEIDYKIIGEDIQVVEIELDPSETVIAEAGCMLFMEDGITFETKMGDGSKSNASLMDKIFQAGSRVLMGESLFMTHFTNQANIKRKVAFAAPYPGTIKAVNMAEISQNTLIVQKDAFLCAAMGTSISIHFNKRFGAGLFGGEGFILEKIQGDGMAFIHSGGVVIEKILNNETLRLDTGCLVAYEPQLNFDIQSAGGLKSMIFGGEGMFLATLTGTGKVWIQSLPISRLIQRLSPYGGNTTKEGGSILGGLANVFER
jgi:uncharacterized protein (TIGR00266 family)